MNSNNWKYFSFVLMGIIAIPTVTSVIAPQANAINATHEMILDIINAIKTKINNNLDDKVSTRATQTSVNNLGTQIHDSFFDVFTELDLIKAKTDNLPRDPASNSHIDSAIASISTGASQASVDAVKAELDIVKCNAPIRSHVNLSGCDLHLAHFSGADLSGAYASPPCFGDPICATLPPA